MGLSLLVLSPGTRQGKSILIHKSPFVIGRAPDCDLRPRSLRVSPRHCAIVVRGDRAFVCDLGSTKGTYLNEQRVPNEAELRNGDQLRIETLRFRVTLEADIPRKGANPPAPSQAADARDEVGMPSEPTPPAPGLSVNAQANAALVPPDEEEAAAAHLLSLPEPADGGGVPESDKPLASTEETASNAAVAATQECDTEGAPKKSEPAKTTPADTTGAAATILQKYLRRPRA
jgi:pSer/pThr/pTyr-binding forkhead associated (FHA) protein